MVRHSLRATAFARRSRAVFIKFFDCTPIRNIFYKVTQYQYIHTSTSILYLQLRKQQLLFLYVVHLGIFYTVFLHYSIAFYTLARLGSSVVLEGSIPSLAASAPEGRCPEECDSGYVHDSPCSPSGTQWRAMSLMIPSGAFLLPYS